MINTQYSAKIRPKNSKIPDVASRSLEELTSAVQQQYINALFVNGVDSIVYIRRERGRPCTCRDIEIEPLNADGSLSRATLDSLLTGTDIVFRESGTRSTDVIPDITPEDTVVYQLDMEPRTSAPPVAAEEPQTENVNILPAGTENCALCFGTGYVGGFDIHQGYRETLDVTLEPDTDFERDHTLNPHRLWTSTAATATFTLILPRAAVSVHSLSVFDNEKLIHASNYDLEVYQNGWSVLTESNLLSFCTGREIKIRLTASKAFRFSHIEIQLSYTMSPVKIDIPRFDEVLHNAIFEGIVGSILILPPTVSKLNKMSMVRESLYGRIWRITNVKDWYDHNMNSHGYETTARLIQQYETSNILPKLGIKVPKPAGIIPHNRVINKFL